MNNLSDVLLEACVTYQRAVALAQLDYPLGEARDTRLREALASVADAFTPVTLEALAGSIAATPAPQQRELQRLHAWGVGIHVRRALLPTLQELQARQRMTTCLVDEEPIPLAASFAAMAAEQRRERRAAIEAAVGRELGTLNGYLAAQFAALGHIAEQLDYPSPAALWSDIVPVDLLQQQELATQILAGTQDVYVDLLAWAVKQRLGLPLGQVKRHDILALFTFPEYQQYYQPRVFAPLVQAGWRDMGLDPHADGRLRWHERAGHFGPPAALAVHIPEEILLSYAPVRGVKGAEAFASACGRAVLWAYTSPTLPATQRYLGDPAMAESHAWWCAEMVAQPRWLRDYCAISVDGSYAAWRRLDRLYRVRRLLGRFLYTQHVYTTNTLSGAAEAYRDMMMEACHVDYPPEYYLLDWDWQYETLTQWRGWIVACGLIQTLRRQFAADWFRNPSSGNWLGHYWPGALSMQPEDLWRSALGGAWEVDPIVTTLVDEDV